MNRPAPMTARERVRAAIDHRPVDRLPIDLGSHPSTGISMFAYADLRRHLGLDTDDMWLSDVVQCLAYVDEDIRQRLHVDCIQLEPPWPATRMWEPRAGYAFHVHAAFTPRRDEDGGWRVERGRRAMRMPAGGAFFDGDWLADWGDGDEATRFARYAHLAERIFHETDYATNFVGYTQGIGLIDFGGGNIDDAMLAYEDPDAVHQKRERTLERNLTRAAQAVEHLSAHVQLISIADDLGSQSAPLCGPAYFEEFCLPYYRKLIAFIHRHSDMKVFLHCCGAIADLMPLLIACGVDVLNPIQVSAAGMDAAGLKARFGRDLCFWGGGCDTQQVLSRATPDAVAAHVRDQIATLAPGSGFVFNQVHNIVDGVPPERILALFDAAWDCRLPGTA